MSQSPPRSSAARAWRWLLGLLVALPFLYLAASVALAVIPGPGPDLSGPPARTIALLQGPIHTDILLPLTPDLRARFGFATAAGVPMDHPGAEWLVFGWGSQAFYTTAGTYADISAAAVLTAAMGDASVIRLDLVGPLTAADNLRYLTLSEAQFQTLLATLLATFTPGPDGQPIPLHHPGFTDFDAFFAADGGFHLLRTCNVWLGETLRASGLRFGLWTPATWSVTLSLDWLALGEAG